MGMHSLRRGEQDLFRLPIVLHGHQEILQALKRKPRKGNVENRTFDAFVISTSQRNRVPSTKPREKPLGTTGSPLGTQLGVRNAITDPVRWSLLLITPWFHRTSGTCGDVLNQARGSHNSSSDPARSRFCGKPMRIKTASNRIKPLYLRNSYM